MAFIGELIALIFGICIVIAIIKFLLITLFGERVANEIAKLIIGVLKLLRVLFSLFILGLIGYGIYILFASIFS